MLHSLSRPSLWLPVTHPHSGYCIYLTLFVCVYCTAQACFLALSCADDVRDDTACKIVVDGHILDRQDKEHSDNVILCRYSPSLLGVKVLEHRPVRRAKLYYLRDRKPSEYKVQ